MAIDVNLNTVCAPSADVVVREIEGEVLIVPLVADVGDKEDELYTLNETGHAIWRELDGQRSLRDVVAALAQQFDAPHSEFEADVLGFTRELTRRGILVAKS